MTEKFEFRKIRPEEYELIEKMQQDEGFNKYFVPDNKMDLVLLNGNIIGVFYLSGSYTPELQIGILPEYRNKGYAVKLTEQIVGELFSEGISQVNLKIHKDNKASLNLAKKCGFHIDWENEELNPENKEDMYYTLYKRNHMVYGNKNRGR